MLERDNLGQFEIRTDRNIRTRSIDIAIFRIRGMQIDILNPLTVTTTDYEVDGHAPTCLRLDYDEAQQLMDELWGSKVRPSRGLSSQGEKEAMMAHIAALETQVLFLRNLVNHNAGIMS